MFPIIMLFLKKNVLLLLTYASFCSLYLKTYEGIYFCICYLTGEKGIAKFRDVQISEDVLRFGLQIVFESAD